MAGEFYSHLFRNIFLRGGSNPQTRWRSPVGLATAATATFSWLGGTLPLPAAVRGVYAVLVRSGGILAALAWCTHSLPWCWCPALVYSLRMLTARSARCSHPSLVRWLAGRVRALLFLFCTRSALFAIHPLLFLFCIHSLCYPLCFAGCSLALTLRYPLVFALAHIARH